MTKIIAVISVLIVLGAGAGYYYLVVYLPEQEAKQLVADSENACAEVEQTTRGIGGPSKRMDILKSYGLEPRQAQALEDYFTLMFEVSDLLRKIEEGGNIYRRKAECMKRAMLSCPDAYLTVAINEEYVLARSSNSVTSCL